MSPVATETAPAAAPTAPWLANLSPESVAAVRAAVAEAPPLSDQQRRRLRMLFRGAPASE
ncbi:hypothetical protein A5721_23835 [Mycobacterium vulneris]|nr:hypothetical protein A5721_23835 [Mycolicibacterium vulneris]